MTLHAPAAAARTFLASARGGPPIIPNHVLNGLASDERVAVLSRKGELHFVVHPAAADPAALRAAAGRDGSEVLTTHLHDPAAIQQFLADREPDTGGEG